MATRKPGGDGAADPGLPPASVPPAATPANSAPPAPRAAPRTGTSTASFTRGNQAAKGNKGPVAAALAARGDDVFRLLSDLKAKRVDPSTLGREQRIACLVVIADGSLTRSQIAALFGCSRRAIERDLRALHERMGREVRAWPLEVVVGRLASVADRCRAGAMEQGDYGLAFSIERDLSRRLQELGVLGPQQEGMRLTVEALGQGYERARLSLGSLDPRVTGEVVEGQVVAAPTRPSTALPLPSRDADARE